MVAFNFMKGSLQIWAIFQLTAFSSHLQFGLHSLVLIPGMCWSLQGKGRSWFLLT